MQVYLPVRRHCRCRECGALLDEASQTDDPVVSLETDFALMTAALGTFTDQLLEWLGGEAEPHAPTEMTP